MITETPSGRVRGRVRGAVVAYLGIPYATAARFEPPQRVRTWPGVRDALVPGPAAPQGPSRLERVTGLGRRRLAQSEDCLSLNVWTPVEPSSVPRPVLVFFHGGGYGTGSGGLEWYDGAALAERGDLVVVTANYRLGALGFLYVPGVSDGNLGLLDSLAALRWVRRGIASFGGDPGAVTVAGQSAGANSILALLSGPRARGLFRHAILQSLPGGMLPQRPEEAGRVGRLFMDVLGLPAEEPGPQENAPSGPHLAPCVELREADPSVLLQASRELARRTSRPLDAVPPFQLVTDGGELVGVGVCGGSRHASGA
ncbi:carboxylesterase family protein [Nonomuraea rhizosphaerae]|uniref:carboxylesterase family protein n=1 Tax=Nonomuraea rhizosphaerae TaxID=2665663 RepID=UPI001C5F74D5|nr:carboxylesterase family protein [Nonomuraea rhizosphaerae]